jgi:hypothetical protein
LFVAHNRIGWRERGCNADLEWPAVLRALLDVVGDAVDPTGATFAERFNLLVDPPQVRFRFLDDALREATAWPVLDCSIPAPSFARQQWSIPRVLVVENRDIFLSLPLIAGTLAVFGSGKALSVLKLDGWTGCLLGRLRRGWLWHSVRLALSVSTCPKCPYGRIFMAPMETSGFAWKTRSISSPRSPNGHRTGSSKVNFRGSLDVGTREDPLGGSRVRGSRRIGMKQPNLYNQLLPAGLRSV